MKSREYDPSSNRSLRAKVGIGGAIFALALSGCARDSEQSAKAPTAKASASANQETRGETLEKHIQKAVSDLSSDIVKLHNQESKDVEKAIKEVPADYLVEKGLDTPAFEAIVIKTTGQRVDDADYGQYYLSAVMQKDKEGRLNPSTVSQIIIGMNTREVDINPPPYGELYELNIIKSKDNSGDVNWTVAQSGIYKDGERPSEMYSTAPEKDSDEIIKLMSSAKFNEIMEEAHTVYDWAEKGAPVNYPPDF